MVIEVADRIIVTEVIVFIIEEVIAIEVKVFIIIGNIYITVKGIGYIIGDWISKVNNSSRDDGG